MRMFFSSRGALLCYQKMSLLSKMSVLIMSPLVKCVWETELWLNNYPHFMKWQSSARPPPSVTKITMQGDLNLSLMMRAPHSLLIFHISQMILYACKDAMQSFHIYDIVVLKSHDSLNRHTRTQNNNKFSN